MPFVSAWKSYLQYLFDASSSSATTTYRIQNLLCVFHIELLHKFFEGIRYDSFFSTLFSKIDSRLPSDQPPCIVHKG